MRYLADDGKLYDTIKEAEAADNVAAKAKDERKAAAEKVEKAYAAMNEAREAYEKAVDSYNDELLKFCDKYGTYKKTLKPGDAYRLDPFLRFLNF